MRAAAFDRSGKVLATGGDGGAVRHRLHEGVDVTALAFDPSGRILAAEADLIGIRMIGVHGIMPRDPVGAEPREEIRDVLRVP